MMRKDSGARLTAWGVARGAVALALAAPVPALAQTTAGETPPQATAETDEGLGDIIVTAQRRSESLQDTPLAISAVTAEMIEDRGIATAADLGAIAPNLTTTTGPNSSAHLIVHIRGIGESEPILTADAPVSVYVDGVVVGRSTGAIFDVVDLERIEVLRGPQGTLYGRNTTGGAVSLITRKPSKIFGVDMKGSYGNWDYFQGRVSVDTGEWGNSGLSAKLSYLHKQRNGYVDDLNAPDSADPGAYNIDAFRVAVAFDPGGAFRANYSYDYSENRSIAPASQLAAAVPRLIAYFGNSQAVGGTPFIAPSLERRDTIRSEGTRVIDKNHAHTLTMEVDLGPDTVLRSLTGFRRWTNDTFNTDIDGNQGLRGLVVSPAPPGIKPIGLFGADKFDTQKQFSQELNLIGSVGDRLSYVLGLFYFDESADEINPQFFTFVTPISATAFGGVNLVNTLAYSHDNQSKAVFGQATYAFTDQLSLTGGLRYTRDDKTLTQTSPISRTLDDDWSKLNYAVTLEYQATPDIMTYARVATGYKAGGFNARSVNQGYEPETLTSYELGVKSDLFDRRLRFNGTLFYAKLKDKQLNQFLAGTGGASSVTVNAGAADFKGIELEVEALPFDGLRLNGAFGYTDRNFETFVVTDPATNLPIDVADEAQFSYSASTTFNAGAQYTIAEVAGGDLSFRLDYTYRSKVNFNVVPRFAQFDALIASPGVGLLDGRITLGDLMIAGRDASIALWGRNLTDETYRTSGIDFGSLGFATNTYGAPRTYGVDVSFKF